ncbi:MAG: hypothetical protein KF729_11670 [Sandaracinaceae bacterium]|nr:hypothetical protein [Sandaracinaceae bacterium]
MGEESDRHPKKRPAKPQERDKRNTFRGFAPKVEVPDLEPEVARFEDEPAASVRVEARPAPPAGVEPQRVARPVRRGQPAVDIDLIHERRTAPLPDHDWTFVEIWTRNTIYALDSRLVCIAVIDQNTRRAHAEHALLGARLVGGQLRDGESMELSHPFPRPGSEAVFEQSKGRQVRFSQTSGVTRVVLRLRVLTVSSDNLLPTWEEITGRHDMPVAPAPSKSREERG